jgi:hypothetical protein
MEKKLATLLILGIGGLAAYHLLKKPDAPKTNASGTTPIDLSNQIRRKSSEKPVQQTLPNFGVPRDLVRGERGGIRGKNNFRSNNFRRSNYTTFASANGFKNYVDVKHNSFFKPELGVFHK